MHKCRWTEIVFTITAFRFAFRISNVWDITVLVFYINGGLAKETLHGQLKQKDRIKALGHNVVCYNSVCYDC